MREIVADKLGIPEEDVTPDASFVDDLGADSLYLTEIVYELEEEFNMRVSEDDLTSFAQWGRLCAYSRACALKASDTSSPGRSCLNKP